MDKTSAAKARSGNYYHQPDNYAASSRPGRYRHDTVRQRDNSSRTIPGHNEFYPSSGTCTSQYLQCRSVTPAQDFNALVKPEIMDDLLSKSDRFADQYDGRNHGHFACSIKKYASASQRPLNRAEQSQLIRLLQNFTVTRNWNWRSLTTTLHSFTSAGVFTPQHPMDACVRHTQAALLSTLLDAITFKCHQKPEARDIDTQPITNLLWAMAKLVDNGQVLTPELKKAVAALLPQVNAQKANFNPQEIANLLWAIAKLGEFVELNVAASTCKSLVRQIRKNPQLSQQDISMTLWGVMVCCARLSLAPNANKKNVFEKYMDDLFTRMENTFPDSREEQTVLAMAASWLGKPCPFVPHYQTTMSKRQTKFHDQLKSRIPSLRIEKEKSLNTLHPVDLLLPDHNIVIEVQGPSHYVCGDFKTRNGSTLLKIALLQKSGFEVIEIPISEIWSQDSMKRCIYYIKTRVATPLQGRASVALKRRRADEAHKTTDKGKQPSDYFHLTAEKHSEEHIGKPKRKKRKRNNSK
ncbi:RAP domain-containing protein [Endozoicomonas acroporae]|uniref:RAP domain-containing protein n=1 Tax=Endozoicomonas acroporae TaxID=1701104 RepID=UPI003D79722D